MIAKKLFTTIAFAFVLLFSGCAEDDFDGVDGLCPLVVSTVPEDGDVDVPLNQIITATFNEKMNPATITETSFTVSINGVLIKGAVSYNGLTATFRPEFLLEPDTEYTGTITTMAKDERGNALQENYVWKFTTLPEYLVVVSSNPLIGGITTGGGEFLKGTAVTVNAIPNANYTFTNWTVGGVQVSISPNYTFVLMGDIELVANYTIIPPKQFAVNTSADPLPGGSTNGSGSFDEGTTVNVTATASTGYNFVNWTVAGVQVSTNPNYSFVLRANTDLVANFVLKTYNIALSVNPLNSGTTSGAGSFNYGSTRTVTATANSNYTFSNWTENGVIVPGAGASYQFVLTGNRTLVANFVPTQLTITLISDIDKGTTSGAGTFNAGTTRTVTATAKSGFTFSNWTENGVIVPGAGASYQFVLTQNRTLTANFTPTQLTITLLSDTNQGTTNGAGTFDSGSTRTVEAIAKPGFTFSNWTENGIIVPGAGANYQFVLTQNRTLTANFTPIQYTITLISDTNQGTTNGAGTFDAGSTRTVEAIAKPGFTFSNWTENGIIVPGAGANYQFVLTGNITLVANFTAISPNPFTIILISDTNQGTTNGAGTFPAGSTRTVTATPKSGYIFSNWTENGIIVPNAGPNYQFVLTEDRTLVAIFSAVPTTGGLCENPAVDLGLAANYAILAKSGVSTTEITSVVGNIGVSPIGSTAITGFGLIMDSSGTYSTSSLVTGRVYAADYTSPTPSNLSTAVSNMETAYTTANLMAPNFTNLYSGNFNGQKFESGVYKYTSGVTITNQIILDGGGNDCAPFIFQIAGSLTVAPGTEIILINGAKADNIYWVVAGSGATLNTDVDFSGNILTYALIAVKSRTTVKGRLLAQSAVTLIGNRIVKPSN